MLFFLFLLLSLFFLFCFTRVRDENGPAAMWVGFCDRYHSIYSIIKFDGAIFAFYFDKISWYFFSRVQALTTFSARESYRQNEEFPMGQRTSHTQKKKKKHIQNKTIKTPSDVIILSYILFVRVVLIQFGSIHLDQHKLLFPIMFTNGSAPYTYINHILLYYIILLPFSPEKCVRFSNSSPTIAETHLDFWRRIGRIL